MPPNEHPFSLLAAPMELGHPAHGQARPTALAAAIEPRLAQTNKALRAPSGAVSVTATDAATPAANAAAWSWPTHGSSNVGSRRASATRPHVVHRQVP